MSDGHADAASHGKDWYKPPPPEDTGSRTSSPKSESSWVGNVHTRPRNLIQPSRRSKISEVLEYMKQAFDDETALDTLPLEAAGNSGAWKAWRAYRRSSGMDNRLADSVPSLYKQDEWSWDGVWEERVRKGIDASIAESTLYGGSGGGDDLVSFYTWCYY